MEYTLNQINEIINGQIIGDGNIKITGVASVEEAGLGDITFIKGEKFIEKGVNSKASAIVVHRVIDELKVPLIVDKDPFMAFVRFLEVVAKESMESEPGIHSSAVLADTVKIGNGVSIWPNVVIRDDVKLGDNVTIFPNVFIGEDCVIGDNTTIHANVSIMGKTSIGQNVTIHPGTVIGGDGFGYLQKGGKHVKIPQVGGVQIGNDVEIGANVTIDRAALDKTIIGNGVKIDNHSHVAHNAVIGENTMLIAYAKIAGGARIGKNVMIAEDVGINDHATIGDNCIVGGGSNVYKSLAPGSVVWGSPARPLNDEKKIQSIITRLPDMRTKIKELEKWKVESEK